MLTSYGWRRLHYWTCSTIVILSYICNVIKILSKVVVYQTRIRNKSTVLQYSQTKTAFHQTLNEILTYNVALQIKTMTRNYLQVYKVTWSHQCKWPRLIRAAQICYCITLLILSRIVNRMLLAMSNILGHIT